MITPWDHLFALVVFLAYPVYTWRNRLALAERIRSEGEPARLACYRSTIGFMLGFALVLAILWFTLGRDWELLGFRWPEPGRLTLGTLAGAALLGLVAFQMHRLRALGEEERAALTSHLDHVLVLFLPATRRELRWFSAVSINAGVTEELIFRGFLLWYLEPLGGAWPAVIAVTLFTLAHAYQGARALPGIAFVAAFFVALYLGTNSLLLPVIFHALVDSLQGSALRGLLAKGPSEAAAAA